MTRENYINYRNNRNGYPLYAYYLEHFNSDKHRPLLSEGEFFMYMQQWADMQSAVTTAFQYYDTKFNVISIPNKEGVIIRYE